MVVSATLVLAASVLATLMLIIREPPPEAKRPELAGPLREKPPAELGAVAPARPPPTPAPAAAPLPPPTPPRVLGQEEDAG
jgi:hypothetical protein